MPFDDEHFFTMMVSISFNNLIITELLSESHTTYMSCFLTQFLLYFIVQFFNPNYGLRNYFSELPVASPLVYACMRMTETWKEYALESINNFGQAPDDFIPGCFSNPSASGPAIEKYRCLFEIQNTPFR